jgi:hypothetical protein
MQQILTQRSLANPEFVGAAVRGSGEQAVGVVLGGSGLESVQTQREIVEQVLAT